MRDPARIDRVLEAVRRVWVENPDLRLGQLIVNAIRPSQPCPQIFGAEDTVLEKGLARHLKDGHERYTAGEVTLELTLDEAIVLFELLARFSNDDKPLAVEVPAEDQVLHKLCGLLEKQLVEPFSKEWPLLLERARRAVRPAE